MPRVRRRAGCEKKREKQDVATDRQTVHFGGHFRRALATASKLWSRPTIIHVHVRLN
jgi:hypothetical protein